jgi:hypothetical protein
MTSSNTIEYTIFKDGEEVGRHRQNIMCKTCNDGLEKFQPAKEYTIQAWGYDEEEEMWESDKIENLEDWLKKHPAQFTWKRFEEGDEVNLTKKRGLGKIKEVVKGKFMPEYVVDLPDGTELKIFQGDIIPKNKV